MEPKNILKVDHQHQNSIQRKIVKSRQIREFLETTKSGEYYSYADIGNIVGFSLGDNEKKRLREIATELKLEYEIVRGLGIKMACPENSLTILGSRVEAVNSKVRRLEQTHAVIEDNFIQDLEPIERRQINLIGAALGAMRVASEELKFIKKQEKAIGNSPENISYPI